MAVTPSRFVPGACLFGLALVLQVPAGPNAWAAGVDAAVEVDFAHTTNGTLRALHGVNLGPLCYRGMVDLSEYHRTLRLPLTRLHDVVWVHADAVDVSTIFRDFRDDPAEPANYDFAATDDYVAAVIAAGSPVLYRLGESIEHTPRKYRVHPPADPAKWAEICCRIVRHYNEGWAAGFRHGIRYWEIWNEPENRPAMWTGTDEQFLDLYTATARAIKDRWPELKVGGPSIGDTGRFEGDAFQPSAFLSRFLRHCREQRLPLDFFSWHRYAADPSDLARRARAIRQLLDAAGFPDTESHLNEWNFLPGEDWRPMMREGQGVERERWNAVLRGPQGAAFAAWALVSLQDAPVDMANFYTAEIQMFGMFDFNGVPQPTYHAFRAFSTLLDTPQRVPTPPGAAGQPAVWAGRDAVGTRAAILLSVFDPASGLPDLVIRGLPWPGWSTTFRVRVLNVAHHDLERVDQGDLPQDGRVFLGRFASPAVVLVQLQRGVRESP